MYPRTYKMRLPKKKGSHDEKKDLVDIVNELQNKLAASGHNLNVSLPQIVVVGCQSAGKSSVLESIVQREFLPRGTGVVTRRPTVVQLQPCEQECAVFLHRPGEIFTDFEEVKAEIEAETNRNPGPVGFSSIPISVQIFSPKVLKLTLVDLPGLIRVVVGNQSEESVEDVRTVVLEYISQPNSLILAVSPANQDISNSDALAIAKKVDPLRERTIGVLTKLDLMDEGTDARDVLENKKISLKRGFIGVLNRSQREIDEKKDFEFCLAKEKHFFASTPAYMHMADRMGTPYLIKTLNVQLHSHIKQSLPVVRQELSQRLTNLRKELRNFNAEIGCNLDDQFGIQSYIIKLTQKFVDSFHTEIFGYSVDVSMDELSAGSIINFKFRDVKKTLKMPQVPVQERLSTCIANLHGVRNTFTLPSLSLETVNNELLKLYIEPLNQLVDSVVETLLSGVEKSSKVINAYPLLKNDVLFFVRNYINDAAFETKETLEKHMQAEMYFANTYYQDFSFPKLDNVDTFFPLKLWNTKNDSCDTSTSSSGSQSSGIYSASYKIGDEAEADEGMASSESAKENSTILAKIVEKYLQNLQKYIEDISIKYIMFFLVKRVMDFVKSGLVQTVLKSADGESICEKELNKMQDVEATCRSLEDALNAIQIF